jgi:NAD(P)-dependent dehydrogenase (short-subunit alcohol dehydrogenase family)
MSGLPSPTLSPAYVLAGIDGTIRARAWELAKTGACFVVLDVPGGAGRALTLALNAGSRGRAVFLPGDPTDPMERAAALAECRQCWPPHEPVLLQPA